MDHRLGHKATDRITGFTGVITAWATFAYSADRVGVTAQALPTDGKPMGSVYFDLTQLDIEDEQTIESYEPVEHGVNMLDKVEDPISGCTGTVIGFNHFISGCVRALVQPKVLKDGAPVEDTYIPVQQLIVTKPAPSAETPRTGGPMHDYHPRSDRP